MQRVSPRPGHSVPVRRAHEQAQDEEEEALLLGRAPRHSRRLAALALPHEPQDEEEEVDDVDVQV